MIGKKELRRSLLAKRSVVTNEQVAAATGRITTILLKAIDWTQVRTVHIYASMSDWKEIGTTDIVELLRDLYPDVHIDSSASAAQAPTPATQYDVIVVPVLGFDRRGYRIGLGKGWYDKFLSTQASARKIGVAYRWAEVVEVPDEPHDVPLDIIITETDVIVRD